MTNLVVDGRVAHRNAAKGFGENDFDTLKLGGAWLYQVGGTEHPVSFAARDGALHMSGPPGDFLGGRSTEAPDILVLVHTSDGPGPPYSVVLNLAHAASGNIEGFTQTFGGDEDEPRAVVIRRK